MAWSRKYNPRVWRLDSTVAGGVDSGDQQIEDLEEQMQRVLKWPLDVLRGEQQQEIGSGRVLHVGFQEGEGMMCVWTLEQDGKEGRRKVAIYGTGWDVPSGYSFLGTVLQDGGRFVWHVFARDGYGMGIQ